MRGTKLLYAALMLAIAAQVGFAKKQTDSSAQITAKIEDKLYHAQVFKHGNVQVTVNNGVATLNGTVDSVGYKMDAERAARKVDGVLVVDNITVHADDVTPRQIAEQARKDVVTYYAYTVFDNINLQLQDGRLVVSGQVTQPFKKSDIGNFLAHIKGVTELDDNLEVLPTSQFDDRLRLAVARAIYRDPFFVHYADQALPPIHIVVKNGNVTLEGVVANQLDRAKADADARLAATYFNFTDNLRLDKA
ncbi:putative periplasmic or secreted lipoprotein [Acidobacteriia bacterium SbA2]|nr:putative periplasmic or secreted lipoprotein [Acidobacteriia bacterium SbA2]